MIVSTSVYRSKAKITRAQALVSGLNCKNGFSIKLMIWQGDVMGYCSLLDEIPRGEWNRMLDRGIYLVVNGTEC